MLHRRRKFAPPSFGDGGLFAEYSCVCSEGVELFSFSGWGLLILSKMSIVPLIRSPALRGVFLQSARRYATRPPPRPDLSNTGDSSTAPSSHDEQSTSPASSQPPPSSSSSLPSLDFVPSFEEEQTQRTGAKSSKGSLSSIERKRRFLGRVSLAVLLLGAGVQTWFLGREWDDGELRERRLVCCSIVRVSRREPIILPHVENRRCAQYSVGSYESTAHEHV